MAKFIPECIHCQQEEQMRQQGFNVEQGWHDPNHMDEAEKEFFDQMVAVLERENN